MIEEEFVIKSEFGLHIRPANELVNRISNFKSEVKVMKDDQIVDGKSVIDLLSLFISKNDKIKFIIEGEDEQEVIKVIRDFIEHDFYDTPVDNQQK
jgi:phosphocarrier protein HPr